MAYLEAKILSSYILNSFQLVVDPAFNPEIKLSITMPFAHGLPVKIIPRPQQ